MQEASVPGFIRTLFWIVALYFILKFLARLFFPVIMKKMVQKAEEQMRKQHQSQNEKDFTATSKQSNSEKPKETKKVGDYIDYEEVD